MRCKINSRAIGDMAIGPSCMFTFRSPAFIKLTRLGKQNKRLLYHLTAMGIKLIPYYFIIGITEVHRCCLLTVPVFKGCGIRKSPINLKYAHAITVISQLFPIGIMKLQYLQYKHL